MGSVADRLRNRPQRTTTVTLAVDPNDAVRWRELRQQAAQAERAAQTSREAAEGQPDSPHLATTAEQAADRLGDAQTALEEFEASIDTVTFHLAGIGPEAVEALIDACPPDKTEKERHKKAVLAEGGRNTYLRFSDRRLAPKLLAACCVRLEASDGTTDEGLAEDDAEELWGSGAFDNGDRMALFQACLQLDQRGSRIGDLGKDSAGILAGLL